MNIYKIIITENERKKLISAIEWYDINAFDDESTLQMLKIHLKSLPQYEEYKNILCEQNGTMAQM